MFPLQRPYWISSRVTNTEVTAATNMFRFGKAALNLTRQASQQVRHGSTASPNFHDKYGTLVMLGGAAFCTTVWSYVLTQTGITWNFSPIGKVQPLPWQQAEEEEE